MSLTLDQIYAQYLRLVRAQVRRVVGDDVDTDDVVQEVFIKYWRGYGHLPNNDIAALLFRMATHAGISALRSRRRRAAREAVFASAGSQRVVQNSDLEVRSLLALVSPPDAEAAALYFLAGMSQKEIADTLATTRHDVMCRLERFESRLKREADKHAWQVEPIDAKKT